MAGAKMIVGKKYARHNADKVNEKGKNSKKNVNFFGASQNSTDEAPKDYVNILLNSDNSRCRLKVYPEDILTDPNLGHWDLFCPKDGKECGKWYEIVELPQNYKARDPLNDISGNPVAIDFGTTGTVVATRDEFGQISLLRIGAQGAGPVEASSHYVNPTVIQIDNIKNLLQAWRELPYRPNVSYEDAQSSHEAKASLNKNYERCLAGLKTWARGKKNATAPIISDAAKNELEISLAPTESAVDIVEDFARLPLNPIELYAFFVGLYLNNQIVDGGRIFTEYYMTFPADFESASRQRILESFRRGLLRSLPPALIYSSGWKPENLLVIERASEPVAYAAAILPLLGKAAPRERAKEPAEAAMIEEIRQIERDLKSKRNSRKKIAALIQPLENKKRVSGEEKQKLQSLRLDLEKLETRISVQQDELGEARRRLNEIRGTGFKNPGEALESLKPLEPSEEGVTFGVFDFGGGTTDIAIGLYRLPTDEEADAKGWERVVDILDTSGDSDLGGEELVRRMVYEVVKENMSALRGNGVIPFERLPGYPHIPGDEEIFSKSLIARENSWKLGEKLRPIWEKGDLDNPENPDQVSETFKKAGSDAPNVILNVNVKGLKKIMKARIAKGVEKFFVTMGQAFKRESISPSEFHVVLAGNSARSPLVRECFSEKIAEIFGGDASAADSNKIILHPPLLPDDNNLEAVTLKTGVAIGLLHLLPGEPMGMVMRQRKGGEAPFAFTVGPLRRGKLEPVLKRNANYGEWHVFGKVLEEGVSKFYYSASPLALNGELERSECREGRLKWPVEDAGKTILVKAVAPDKIVFTLQKNGAGGSPETEQEFTLKQ